MRLGPPKTSFPLQSGGTVYSWQVSDVVLTIPAQYQTVKPPSGFDTERSKSTTTVIHPGASTTVAETRFSSFSFGAGPAATRVLVAPARTVPLYCQAQISVDPAGIVNHVHVTADTQGTGLQLRSRVSRPRPVSDKTALDHENA